MNHQTIYQMNESLNTLKEDFAKSAVTSLSSSAIQHVTTTDVELKMFGVGEEQFEEWCASLDKDVSLKNSVVS